MSLDLLLILSSFDWFLILNVGTAQVLMFPYSGNILDLGNISILLDSYPGVALVLMGKADTVLLLMGYHVSIHIVSSLHPCCSDSEMQVPVSLFQVPVFLPLAWLFYHFPGWIHWFSAMHCHFLKTKLVPSYYWDSRLWSSPVDQLWEVGLEQN